MKNVSGWAQTHIEPEDDGAEYEAVLIERPEVVSVMLLRAEQRSRADRAYRSLPWMIFLTFAWFEAAMHLSPPWAIVCFLISMTLLVATIMRFEEWIFARRASRMKVDP